MVSRSHHTCGPEPQGVTEQAKEEPWQPMSPRMAMGSGAETEQDGVPAALTGGRRWARLCKGYQLQAGGQAETPCPHGSDGPAWPTALYTGHTLLGQETPCSPQPWTCWPCLNTSSPGHSLARPQGITYASSLVCALCLPTPAIGQRPTFPLLFSLLLLCASCHTSPPLGSMSEVCGEGYGFITGETSTPGQAAWSKVTPSLCLSGPPDQMRQQRHSQVSVSGRLYFLRTINNCI